MFIGWNAEQLKDETSGNEEEKNTANSLVELSADANQASVKVLATSIADITEAISKPNRSIDSKCNVLTSTERIIC